MVNILMIVALLTDLIHRSLIKDVQQDAEIQNYKGATIKRNHAL
jgi:hypothetical protein